MLYLNKTGEGIFEELLRLFERAERDSLRDMVRKNKMQVPKKAQGEGL